MIRQLHREQTVAGDLTRVWEFFASPQNLNAITPGDLTFRIVGPTPARMYAGQVIEYRIGVRPGVTTRWLTEITHVRELEYFVDEQRVGPYRLWHHEHHFATPDGARSRDDRPRRDLRGRLRTDRRGVARSVDRSTAQNDLRLPARHVNRGAVLQPGATAGERRLSGVGEPTQWRNSRNACFWPAASASGPGSLKNHVAPSNGTIAPRSRVGVAPDPTISTTPIDSPLTCTRVMAAATSEGDCGANCN
jgi:ligand-binding SRPBCC domain-containing protein